MRRKQIFSMHRTTGDVIEDWEPSAELRERLIDSMASQFVEWEHAHVAKHFVRCGRCKQEARQVGWVEPEPGALLGPHCAKCQRIVLDGFERDTGPANLPVYLCSGSTKALDPLKGELKARARTVSEVELHVTVPDEDLF